MDCEGAEFQIIPHADKSTLRKIARVAMEYRAAEGNEEIEMLVRAFEKAGFVVQVHQKPNVPLGMLFAMRRMPLQNEYR